MLLDHGGERSFEDVIDGLGEYTEEKPSAYSVLKSLAAAGVIHIAPMAPEINLMTTAPDATSYTGATVRARRQLMLYVWRQMEEEFRDRLREWHASQVRQMGGWVSAGQLGQVRDLVCCFVWYLRYAQTSELGRVVLVSCVMCGMSRLRSAARVKAARVHSQRLNANCLAHPCRHRSSDCWAEGAVDDM
jgi:hypothetical protein